MIQEYYQAVGIVFGSWCLIQGIIDGLRPVKPPPPTETVKTWERVEYKEEEKELETTINFEL
jgi:hypothetical protein